MTFTAEDVMASMERAVKERGADYVYKAPAGVGECVYVAPDGTPSCIVGWVVNDLAPGQLSRLKGADEEYGGTAADQLTNGFLPSDFWTERAANLAIEVQNDQDGYMHWGKAVSRAKERHGL